MIFDFAELDGSLHSITSSIPLCHLHFPTIRLTFDSNHPSDCAEKSVFPYDMIHRVICRSYQLIDAADLLIQRDSIVCVSFD
jgi:hypothetical protein